MQFRYECGAVYIGDDETPILHLFMEDPYHLVYYMGEERHKLPIMHDASEANMVRRPFKTSTNTRYEIEMIYHGDLQKYIRDSIAIDIPFCAPTFRIRNRRKDLPDILLTPIISVCDLNAHPVYDEVGMMHADIDKAIMDPYRISLLCFTEGYEEFFDGLYERQMLFFE